MNKNSIFVVGGVILVLALFLEVFYFRFHVYFQETVVNEALPTLLPKTDADPMKSAEPVKPQTLVKGSFVEVDAVHKGSGTARIILQDDKRYLRFDNFQVTNGPDLYVYLSESKTPGGDLKSLDKYISLGLLKGNIGDQNYEIPENFQGYNTAVIWCQKFGVLFSYAVMEPIVN